MTIKVVYEIVYAAISPCEKSTIGNRCGDAASSTPLPA